jgi:UDP-N-acetylglucosamine 4,6-dehydratase
MRYLITGGTGSFGHYMVKELLKKEPEEIRIFSRDEEKQFDMQRLYPNASIKYFIGDVRDCERVNDAIRGADIVFHAAALKIIPTGENNPEEFIKTNIQGTINVAKAVKSNGIKGVFISTDKAVKPVNLYGMTKGVAEKVWLSYGLPTVRYGNVLGSRGSIAPFFRELYLQKKAFPITHHEMTRFMITLKEAIDLVFHAVKGGPYIYVPKIPAFKVVDFASAMGGKNYPTIETGIRPGEKIHECLINEFELLKTSFDGKYYEISNKGDGSLHEEYTSKVEKKMSVEEIRRLLKRESLLPEDRARLEGS